MNLSKRAREALFIAEMQKNQFDIEEQFAHAIHSIERNTGIVIGEDFPLMKFWNLVQKCEMCEMEEAEQRNR